MKAEAMAASFVTLIEDSDMADTILRHVTYVIEKWNRIFLFLKNEPYGCQANESIWCKS